MEVHHQYDTFESFDEEGFKTKNKGITVLSYDYLTKRTIKW